MTQLGYYHSNCLEGLRKTTKNSIRMDSVMAEIWTRHLLNIHLENYQ
jgi:hypothetical protein